MTKKYNESVLVVKDQDIQEALNTPYPEDGFNQELLFTKIATNGTFLDRNLAEIDITYRQIIPYVFITDIVGNILLYNRKAGDGRLLNKYSIGFGGHINECDKVESEFGTLNAEATILNNIARELKEELYIDISSDKLYCYNDCIKIDDTEVDKMHLGLIYHLFFKDLSFIANDRDYNTKEMELDLVKLDNLLQDTITVPKLENWSKVLLETIRKAV